MSHGETENTEGY